MVSFDQIHEDDRGRIFLVQDLISGGREFTFLEIKKGFARGGCLHRVNENFVVIRGKLRFIHGEEERLVSTGDSGLISAGVPHAFVAVEDSIVSEWGVTTSEKVEDKKDPSLREVVDAINREASSAS